MQIYHHCCAQSCLLHLLTVYRCSLSLCLYPGRQNTSVKLRKYLADWFQMDVKSGLHWTHPPLNSDLLSSWHFLAIVGSTYILYVHLGDSQGAQVAQVLGAGQAVYPQRQDADADAQGEVTRLRLWGSVIFAVPPRNNTLDCMYSFYLPEFTKIWMSVTCWPQGERKRFFFIYLFLKMGFGYISLKRDFQSNQTNSQIARGWFLVNTQVVHLSLSNTELRPLCIDFYQLASRHDWMTSGWGRNCLWSPSGN